MLGSQADPGTPAAKNQDSKHNTNMQAAAYVYACTETRSSR